MNRKNFLSSMLTFSAGLPLLNFKDEKKGWFPVIPKYLKPGDIIGITAPAGHIDLEEIQPAILQMESWGFKTKIGNTIGKKDFTFGGTDEERADDFQQLMDDPAINAIMCARGGYGMVRIIDNLDFSN